MRVAGLVALASTVLLGLANMPLKAVIASRPPLSSLTTSISLFLTAPDHGKAKPGSSSEMRIEHIRKGQ
jgi:hypothetical protein